MQQNIMQQNIIDNSNINLNNQKINNSEFKTAFANHIKQYLINNNINQVDIFKLSSNDFEKKYNITQQLLQKKISKDFENKLSENILTEIERKKEEENKLKEKHISFILNQTDYDYNIALKKYEEYNFDYERVIREYLNKNVYIKDKNSDNKNQTINQKIYKEIRDFMDNI
jgi:hypothetical protein